MNPWFGCIVVLASLASLLLLCKFFTRYLQFSTELARKLVHIGMGIICSSFPFIFSATWPVFLLAGAAIVSLMLIRTVPLLRNSIGSSLHGVKRYSLGEIYFPVAVATVWFLSFDKPIYYSLSVLVLTFADAFAALIGTRYGQQLYTTKDGYKTWEGSFIFFSITFLCIHIPLLLLTDIGRPESILIALLIAFMVMIVEAVSWNGLDNLLIPLSVCIFLNVYKEYSAEQMLGNIGLLVVLVAIMFVVRCRMKLDDASLLGTSLLLYLIFLVGSWQWVFAPVVVLINYLYLCPQKNLPKDNVHNIHSLLAVTLPGFLWLFLYFRYEKGSFLFYYNLAYTAELICIYIAQWAYQYQNRSLLQITMTSALLGFVMLLVPYIWFFNTGFSFKILIVSLTVALLSSQLFRYFQPQIRNCPLTSDRWIRQGGIGLIVSFIPWIIISVMFG
jgi:phytol kinase